MGWGTSGQYTRFLLRLKVNHCLLFLPGHPCGPQHGQQHLSLALCMEVTPSGPLAGSTIFREGCGHPTADPLLSCDGQSSKEAPAMANTGLLSPGGKVWEPAPQPYGGTQLDSEGHSHVSPMRPPHTHTCHPRCHAHASTAHLSHCTHLCWHAHLPMRGAQRHSPLDTRSSIHSLATSSWSLSSEPKSVRLSFKPGVIGWGQGSERHLRAPASPPPGPLPRLTLGLEAAQVLQKSVQVLRELRA